MDELENMAKFFTPRDQMCKTPAQYVVEDDIMITVSELDPEAESEWT